MTYEQFEETLTLKIPPAGIPELVKALWYDAKGDWEAAHNIAQRAEGTRDYDRLHAYLHRVEGDTFNAGYWYRRAGAEVFKGSFDEERAYLVSHFS